MAMLPPAVQPADLEQGYQIQDIVAARDAVAGGKVAATSLQARIISVSLTRLQDSLVLPVFSILQVQLT